MGLTTFRPGRRHDDEARKERETQLKRVARAQRRVAVLLALIAVVLAGAGTWIIMQARMVGRQTSLVLASNAEKANDVGINDRSLRYMVIGAQTTWLSPASDAEAELVRAAHASRLTAQLDGHEDRVNSAAFSADGKQVVTGSHDRTARIWDVATGKQIARLDGHEDTVLSASYSANGRQVVTASTDKTARIWDVATGKQIARLDGHTGSVLSASFNADGKQVVTAFLDKTARIWDAASGKQIARLDGHTGSVLLVLLQRRRQANGYRF